MAAPIHDLLELLHEIADLGSAQELLWWDERTQMPPAGAPLRAEQLATLTRLRHQRLASDELGRLLESAARALDDADTDSFEARLVRITRRDWEKARRVPAELHGEIARVTSNAESAWAKARERSAFPELLPHLKQVLELTGRYIECFEVEHPYDALLDDYEPGMRTAELRPVLEALRDGVAPLVAAVAASDIELDSSPLYGEFEDEAQALLARDLAGALPLEPGAWRLDETVHPFATGIGVSDVRVTTRFDPGYVGSSLWAVIHEVGHAMYRNGIDRELERTPLCRSASLGFDESQSRLWENWVGRGRPFMEVLVPLLRKHFPGRFEAVDADALYRAANRVKPSLIRVEADEVTYNLHIVLRFELELALVEERLKPAELPEAWNERMRELLAVDVPDDANGVLQDPHWSGGAFGYFPTYSLGNVIAAQLWELAREAHPDLDRELATGELTPLRDLLRRRLHRHGGKYEPSEMIERITGGPLDPAPLLTQLETKYAALYELDL